MSVDERIDDAPVVQDCVIGSRTLFRNGCCILSDVANCPYQDKNRVFTWYEHELLGCRKYAEK